MFSEEDILEKLKCRDERCMRMLFDNYYHALCVYALKYLPLLEDAEDVVQNVFVAFWVNKQGKVFEGSVLSFRGRCQSIFEIHGTSRPSGF